MLPSNAKPNQTTAPSGEDAVRVKTTLLLDLDTVEWGKKQSGGLSEVIRRLLRQAYEANHQEGTK